MKVINVNDLNISDNINSFEWVILDIYEDNDFLSEVASQTMNSLSLNVSNNIKLLKIKLNDFKKACDNNLLPFINYDGYPEIILLRNGRLSVKFPSLARVGKIVDIIRKHTSMK